MKLQSVESRWAEIWSRATRGSVSWRALSVLLMLGFPLTATAGVTDAPCPPGAIAVEPGASIQAAVDSAGEGATFCLRNGIHRMQAVRPRSGQSFYGEGRTILSGSRLLTNYVREGRYWVATNQSQRGRKHGECTRAEPACD